MAQKAKAGELVPLSKNVGVLSMMMAERVQHSLVCADHEETGLVPAVGADADGREDVVLRPCPPRSKKLALRGKIFFGIMRFGAWIERGDETPATRANPLLERCRQRLIDTDSRPLHPIHADKIVGVLIRKPYRLIHDAAVAAAAKWI